MLANFLSKSRPINFLVLLLLFFCCYITVIYFNFFVDGFHLDKLLKSVAILGFFLALFFSFNFILTKNNLTLDNSYAFFLFTLFICFLLPNLIDYKILILMLLHFGFIRKVYSLNSAKDLLKKLFDAGFWLGISFLIEPSLVVYFILIYVAILLHQKTTIHTILSPIIGFLTPLFLYFTYFFWFDKSADFLQLFSFDALNNLSFFQEEKSVWFVSSLIIMTFIALFIKSQKALFIGNSFKRSWILLMINALLALLFMLLIKVKNGSEIVYVLFPTSIIIANGIEVINKKWIKNVIFIVVLIDVILIGVFL